MIWQKFMYLNFLRNKILIALAAFSLCEGLHAQVSVTQGEHLMEFSGMVTTFYNYRDYLPGSTSFKKNRFSLRDAQMKLEGRVGNRYEYEFQMDLADIAAGGSDPESTPLLDANVTYKGDLLTVIAGFQKTPYSFQSLTPFLYIPFFQRPEPLRGELFARRDIGVTLKKSWWKNRITWMGGAYTGLGNFSLLDNNDPSGKPEFVSRVELAWPTQMDYRMVDVTHSPIPRISLGLNGRYLDKKANYGTEYQLLAIDGKKLGYGMDLALHYKGISILMEAHQFQLTPNDTARLFGFGYRDKSFKSGVFSLQGGYFSKMLKAGIFARYDHYNLNDHYKGVNEELSVGLIYIPKGWKSALKFHYRKILQEEQDPKNPEAVIELFNYKQQFRVGWCYQF